jgi:ficolin
LSVGQEFIVFVRSTFSNFQRRRVESQCNFYHFSLHRKTIELFSCKSSHVQSTGCPNVLLNFSFSVYPGILVQQHYNGTTFFQRNWAAFKAGFGDNNSNYWIGNDQLHQLTMNGRYRLRVDLQGKLDCQWYWAQYNTFIVSNEASFYQLAINGYTGTAGDSMVNTDPWSALNRAFFTTSDSDHDGFLQGNCAITPKMGYDCGGGFWYRSCAYALVNCPQGCYPGFAWYGNIPGAYGPLMYSRLTLI